MSNIKISIGDALVDNVSIVEYVFWCSGSQYIDGGAISDVDPLRISLSESVDLLDYSVESQTHERVRAHLDRSGSDIIVKFDYLEPGDGAKISITYCNKGDCDQPAKICGTIKGVPNIGVLQQAPLYHFVEWVRRLSGLLLVAAFAAMFGGLFFIPSERILAFMNWVDGVSPSFLPPSSSPFILFVLIYLFRMFLFYVLRLMKMKRVNIPKCYNEFARHYVQE